MGKKKSDWNDLNQGKIRHLGENVTDLCTVGQSKSGQSPRWSYCHRYQIVRDGKNVFLSFLLSTLRRYPDSKDKVKALYIRIVSPFPEMERFLQDTVKR